MEAFGPVLNVRKQQRRWKKWSNSTIWKAKGEMQRVQQTSADDFLSQYFLQTLILYIVVVRLKIRVLYPVKTGAVQFQILSWSWQSTTTKHALCVVILQTQDDFIDTGYRHRFNSMSTLGQRMKPTRVQRTKSNLFCWALSEHGNLCLKQSLLF